MKKHVLYPVCFSAALTLFTLYAVLDTFVIKETFLENATEMNFEMFEETNAAPIEEQPAQTQEKPDEKESASKKRPGSGGKGNFNRPRKDKPANDPYKETENDDISEGSVIPENGSLAYTDENISISISEYYENGTHIYAADVKLSSAQYLKTAFADNAFGKNITEKTSVIAKENNAVFAVNGDYYGARENGCVIRNGVAYREPAGNGDILCVYSNGKMEVRSSKGLTCDTLISEKVWQAWDFGPALIVNGNIAANADSEVGRAMTSNPRTAVGMIEPLHYLFVVSDGRTSESKGLSLYELAEFMSRAGVQTAYNLDGGGSSAMYFNGSVINNPTSNGKSIKERDVSDIVYIG